MRAFAFSMVFSLLAANGWATELEIYRGEPFSEALHDIVLRGSVAVSHPLVQASPLERTDAFKLRDGRLLVLFSVSKQLGEPYSIKKLLVSPSVGDSKKLESVAQLKLPPIVEPMR